MDPTSSRTRVNVILVFRFLKTNSEWHNANYLQMQGDHPHLSFQIFSMLYNTNLVLSQSKLAKKRKKEVYLFYLFVCLFYKVKRNRKVTKKKKHLQFNFNFIRTLEVYTKTIRHSKNILKTDLFNSVSKRFVSTFDPEYSAAHG
jgi:hypothetical protein